MPTKRIEERFALTGGKVDRTGPYPVLRGALLCGAVSANGRDYPARAFAGNRIKRYEGKSVFLNHSANPGKSRDIRDKIAWIENARHREDGMPIGDIGFNPKHADADAVLWAAENKPDFCGLSHVADCKFSSRDGRDVVEDVVEVLSVDIVVDPATTKGFFENKEPTMKQKITLAKFHEWLAKNPKSTVEQCLTIKALAQTYTVQEMDEPAEDAEPGAAINDAFRSLLHAHVDELLSDSQTIDDFIKKVKGLHRAHKGGEKNGEGGGEEKKEEPKEKEEKPMESKQIGYERAIALCAEAKYAASPTEYKLIAKFDTDAEAKSFIAEQSERVKAVAEQKPRSTGRTVATPPAAPVQEQRAIPAWNRAASKN